jgi:hypothetical protein
MRTKLVAIVFGLLLTGCGDMWSNKRTTDLPQTQPTTDNKSVTIIDGGHDWYNTLITATPVPGGTLYVAKDNHGLGVVFVPTPK